MLGKGVKLIDFLIPDLNQIKLSYKAKSINKF